MKTSLLPTFLALACAACTAAAPPTNRAIAAPPASTEAAPPSNAAAAAPDEAPADEALPSDHPAPTRASLLSPAETRSALADLGMRTLTAMERGDAKGFARLVHPGRGLDLGLLGGVSHHLVASEVRAAFGDATPRAWDGRSNAADEPLSMTYHEFFASLGHGSYAKADRVGYGEVVQEDSLCGRSCVAEVIASTFPGAPFIQYAYPSGTDANPGMWRYLVVAFDRDATGWHVIGLFEDNWSP